MTKLKDFVETKLKNFKLFITEELNKVDISPISKKILISDLEYYSNDVNVFIQAIMQLMKYDVDNAVKLFLLKYDIKVEEIKNKIDYEKLKRYLNMFMDILK